MPSDNLPSVYKKNPIEKARRGVITAKKDFFMYAKYDLTLNQQKIIWYAILVCEQRREKFSTVDIPVATFMALAGNTGGSAYERFKQAANALIEKKVEVLYKDNKKKPRYEVYTWIKKIAYDDGIVSITLNDALQGHVIGTPFEKTEYYYLFKFRSQFSTRLYQLLKAFAFKNEADFEVEDLKQRLSCDKYDRYADFKRRVLMPALEDIEHITDLKVSFKEELGRRKKVVRLWFTIDEQNHGLLADREESGEFDKLFSTSDISFPKDAPPIEISDAEMVEDFQLSFLGNEDTEEKVNPDEVMHLRFSYDESEDEKRPSQEHTVSKFYIPIGTVGGDADLEKRKNEIFRILNGDSKAETD